MAWSQHRWVNDDAAWEDEAFRRIADEYGVETGWAAQEWYQGRALEGDDLQRRVDRVEASLPRILNQEYGAETYEDPLVDHLYTISKVYGPEEVQDGGAPVRYYERGPQLETHPEAVILDDNVLYDMLLCSSREIADWPKAPDRAYYGEVIDNLPAERIHDQPWHTGFAVLDEVRRTHHPTGSGIGVFYPERPLKPVLYELGAGVTAEVYDVLAEIGNPLDVNRAPRTSEPDIARMGEDTILAEEAEARNALVVTNDSDFLVLEDHFDFTALPPDIALYELSEQIRPY